MSEFQLIQDKKYPNAATVYTPTGKKIRLSEYVDGRLRFRLAKAGPALLQEAYLSGQSDDVILSVVPVDWARSQQLVLKGALGEVISAAKYLEDFADTLVATLRGLSYQISLLSESTISDAQKRDALRQAEGYVRNLSTSAEQASNQSRIENRLSNTAYELRQTHQLYRVKKCLAHVIESWNGKNFSGESVEKLVRVVDEQAAKLNDKDLTEKLASWAMTKDRLQRILGDVLAAHQVVSQKEGVGL